MKIDSIKTPDDLFGPMKALGYKVFDGPEKWDLNIIGVRSPGGSTNTFNDRMYVVARDDSGTMRILGSWEITTDPGDAHLLNPENRMGTACLVPGQYRGAYRYGLHKGKPALVQVKEVKVYRDKDKNKIHSMDPHSITEGVYGINIHRAGPDSQRVDLWSAGCQVFKKASDIEAFLKICVKQSNEHPGWDLYTYTLLLADE